ncbi:MAG: GNAT family N-acetyltransferase [Legionellales bacterium]
MLHAESLITEQTLNWVRHFIIKYNLCPFAKKPVNKGSLRIQVSAVKKKTQALEALLSEVVLLDQDQGIETTLLVFSHAFKDFFTYLDFIALAEQLLKVQGYEGIYQIATFHPDYCFADTETDDASNYTNRSPYPMLHLLREETLEKAIDAYGDTDKIPEKNTATMHQLGIKKLQEIQRACLGTADEDSMSFEIIPITEAHIEGFWAAVDSVARERKYLAFLEGPPINMTKDFVLQNIRGNWPHFVAIKDAKIIGWCDISALDRPVFAHIGSLGIGVLAPYRGQGIGEALMKVALEEAKNKGLTRIELTVRENNETAIALYKKLGFEKEGIHKNAVCIDGKYENHLFMALLY